MNKISLLIIFTFLFLGCESDEDKIRNLELEIKNLELENSKSQNKINILENTLKKFNIEPVNINNQNNDFYNQVFGGN